jgi:hypothetical protein
MNGGMGRGRGRKDGYKGGVKGLSSRAEVREKVRGEYGFSSLVKQNKKAKIYAVICFAGKRNLLFLYL